MSYILASRFECLRARLSLNDHDDDVHETLGDCSSNLEPNFPYNPTYLCIEGEKCLTLFCAATTSRFALSVVLRIEDVIPLSHRPHHSAEVC